MSVFDDLYDIDQENNLSIEIMDNNLLQEFKLWYDDISNDKYNNNFSRFTKCYN